MRVPQKIREVKRPERTIVYAYGRNPVRYGVKKRNFVRVDGKVVQKDGETVGHIVDGRFIPIDDRVPIRYDDSDFLYWADAQLAVNLSGDILDDLIAVYHHDDALRLYIMALLRATEPELKDDEMKTAYEQSYLSVMYPGVALSKDVVSWHLHNLGRMYSHINDFMLRRTSRVSENHNVAVDRMPKSDESEVNSLSALSRKTPLKRSCNVSVMFAFDIETLEPVCSKMYPGNMPDTSAFADFLTENRIEKGIIIVDKSFNYSSAKKVFLDNPGLHFLIPLRRGSTAIAGYRMLFFDSSLQNRDGIQCRKVRMQDGRFLYSFRNVEISRSEERSWTKSHPSFDESKLDAMRREFGTIVFLSDLDVPPETMYAAYEEKWEIEVMFRFYKSILELDETSVHDDMSIIGTEFINLLSTIITCRMRKAFFGVEQLRRKSYRNCLRFLRKGVMSRPDREREWAPRRLTETEERIFIQLGILRKPELEKRGPGR